MGPQQDHISNLLQLYLTDRANPGQVEELFALLKASYDDADFDDQFQKAMQDSGLSDSIPARAENKAASFEMLLSARESLRSAWEKKSTGAVVTTLPTGKLRFLHRMKWVAMIIALIGTGTIAIVYFSGSGKNAASHELARQTALPDVQAPEKSRAFIVLADGQTISLDSLNQGLLANQGAVKLVKLDNGKIAYQSISAESIQEDQLNTLSNPRGSKVVEVILNDGSHVWLNAGSSITYPVAFTGKQRKVIVTGEAYFEVAQDATKPFYVSKGDWEVKVLGTNFNIDAYDDDLKIKVTLLKGSVKVSNSVPEDASGKQSGIVLKPGQQAIAAERQLAVNNTINLDAVMAWKNGYFNFNHADLPSVLQQISRWYDVEIVYQGPVPTMKFIGEIQRDFNLSEVLDVLTRTDVHFKIEGKKLIVTQQENE
ncbi:FecR family protein [Pseudobacter ginsenosidimutans]|uniref:FecR family protein n=1 Tax=Pseudobacter ginsenosidimutans TaxID=661488 RepID=A0A4Q7N0P0_9BACT|nr:FecR family protein [Pseudobacter ginsenosidimutans]QEC43466.1 DUF4974 domain-containing protein [Pseudobacter ginsenosidimutans]RZS74853.1 FecR family protein [Pseudobacter ginsenosidimutans]